MRKFGNSPNFLSGLGSSANLADVMRKNVIWWDRLIRFLLGIVMLTWAIAGGPGWAYLGLYPLASASWGYCPIYAVLGLKAEED